MRAAIAVVGAAAIAALWFPSWRKLGLIMLGLLAWSYLCRLIGEIGYRWSVRRRNG